MALRNYRDLKVWNSAMEVVDQAYSLTESFPDRERFGLTSQIQRAAVSIAANIAEGYGRCHRGDYIRFLSIARGSLCEFETLLTIAVRRKYTDREMAIPVWQQAQEIGKMLSAMIRKLRTKQSP